MRKLFLLALVAAAVIWSGGNVRADGGFYVISSGGPPVGTKITSLPYTIQNPGFYYLTGNFNYTGTSDAILINSDDVTIDLMGFSLLGPVSIGSNCGINLNNHKNVQIRNGTMSNWVSAITLAPITSNLLGQAINLRIENCQIGIGLRVDDCLVKGCMVTDCTWGIYINSGTASDNVVNNCYCGIEGYTNGVLIKGNTIIKCAYGLWAAGGSIIGNTVVTNSGQTGINIATFDYVLLVQNTVSGVGTPVANATAACVKVPNTNAGL